MTDMIERVARGLCSYSEFMWQDNIPKAKAAIEAMREPTDEMVAAGFEPGCFEVRSVYTAMINAALKETNDDD